MSIRKNQPTNFRGFMNALRNDVAGNVLALSAAAIVPTIGLIGAGVDMSRMYLTKTRLQGACDAATLMGRKTMGTGTWDANNNRATAAANEIFASNFPSGEYGTSNLQTTLSESNSVVKMTASADVPMTLTKILGAPTRSVAIECTAELTIPNTDVMFVLDTTGSMGGNAAGGAPSSSNPSRISGLRVAVKCFYEAIAKEDIKDETVNGVFQQGVSKEECQTTKDPSGGNHASVQLRFGFVPYSVNVNVGKLLPLDYMADQWTYQSRQPLTRNDATTAVPVYGTEGDFVQQGQPQTVGGNGSDWVDVPADSDKRNFGSESYSRIAQVNFSVNRFRKNNNNGNNNNGNNNNGNGNNRVSSQSDCDSITPRPDNVTAGTAGLIQLVSQTTPVYPATYITKIYTRVDSSSGVEYRYKYIDDWNGYDPAGGGYSVNGDTTSAWKPEKGWQNTYQNSGWRWDPVNWRWVWDNGGWAWREIDGTTIRRHCRLQVKNLDGTRTTTFTTTTPITWQQQAVFDRWSYQPVTFNVSGLKRNNQWNTSVDLPIGNQGSLTSVGWGGCIEERKTVRYTGSGPVGFWNTIPADAWDMKIDEAPVTTDATTKWGPLLYDAVYLRRDGNNNATVAHVETPNDMTGWKSSSYYCPTESKLHQTWIAKDFRNYVNSLTVDGNTYHDIGLLWGARLASPQGIFKTLNAPVGKAIERHMIFMTDGDTNTNRTDMNAYGTPWWDRRQSPSGTAPSDSDLDTNVDERTKAICTAIKNKNITLWVIAYGSTIDATTKTRLENCASPGKYYAAADTTALLNRFKQLAADISQLRLTN